MTASTASVRTIKNATASIRSTRATQPAAPRAQAKTKAAKAVEQITPVEEVKGDDTETSTEEMFASWRSLMGEFKMPSGRRMAVSVVAQLFVMGSGMYSGMQVAAALSVGAAVLTGSAFIAFLLWFIAAGIALYASVVGAARVGKYIALGQIDEDAAKARAWVSAKWSSITSKVRGHV